MKTFTASLILSTALAQKFDVNTNGSLSSNFGYGYGVGNDYLHGDSHGHNMGHQLVEGYGDTTYTAGFAYTADQASDHIFGYDSVPVMDTAAWTTYTGAILNDGTAGGTADALKTQIVASIAAANTSRVNYIQNVLQKRRNRLMEINADHVLKVVAPFELQLDLLDQEILDVQKAKGYATTHAKEYFTDLTGAGYTANTTPNAISLWTAGRMNDYYNDRVDALDREKDLVIRSLERAVEEAKPVEDVLAAMRIDWLQGVYINGNIANYDTNIYDLTVFDSEFDLFTYDMGHGKGHGHTNQSNRGQMQNNIGLVVGAGQGAGDISQLKGQPRPVDGKMRRYDRQTLSGKSGQGQVSDYELGLRQAQQDGRFEFDEAASLQVARQGSSRGRAPRGPSRGQKRQRRRGGRRSPARRPAGYGSTPAGGSQESPSYQKTRQVSRRTSYDDYSKLPAGGYGYRRRGPSGAY